jgi:hypothetical protein
LKFLYLFENPVNNTLPLFLTIFLIKNKLDKKDKINDLEVLLFDDLNMFNI